ncbi:3'-5' exonuclease [Campylobacter sp. MIT 12-8780]|uniref:3'-5' exonuclease n=1 Tax=unclassified Campylobacter TaxID=2593542 RepID=UPI0010F69888|nr:MULTISPECIES: 3'-5' exonuclease [unclassified Campylobacter]NDJ27510.1 3'-5' exonuclease [Campylobacter sp. MIT 19-121]TKX28785.1 3'-5' exonuclease [Campylobacter sp. MIT 12-5580]TQR41267.1 3'-5' exonuclease [Campylobacter sp. MIT 12-8780]
MSQQQIDEFVAKLAKQNKPYTLALQELNKIEELDFIDFDLYMLELLGLSVNLNAQNELTLKSKSTALKDQIFCVVDIESNGSFKRGGQIIEIGAVKIQNYKEIAHFNTLIKASNVPLNIQELTGISSSMLQNAPSLASVLNEFRLFLKDSIFVAHNVRFDYGFISSSLQECGFGVLLNQRLCTIDLARRLIQSERYGLDSLKEILHITSVHHRALSDAKAAAEILKHCLKKLPFYIKTTQELLDFSKNTKTLKATKA